jgi:hypothetical protein
MNILEAVFSYFGKPAPRPALSFRRVNISATEFSYVTSFPVGKLQAMSPAERQLIRREFLLRLEQVTPAKNEFVVLLVPYFPKEKQKWAFVIYTRGLRRVLEALSRETVNA